MTYPLSSVLFATLMALLPIWIQQMAVHEQEPIRTINTGFRSEDGLYFQARIVAPAEKDRNGYGVLMLGGGLGNDLDWSSPGFVDDQGTMIPISLSGKVHADAPLIATALAERGFVVMHWGTYRPAKAEDDIWPNQGTMYPVKDLFRFSNSALKFFRNQRVAPVEKVILLGHSMGAIRSANMAADDDQIAGLVLLASAQLTRTSAHDPGKNINAQATSDFLQLVDRDADKLCSESEFSTWVQLPASKNHPLADQAFQRLDFFPDGQLASWEIAAGLARHTRSLADFINLDQGDRSGMRWTEDILRQTKIDTLIVYGSLDQAQAFHAPIMADLIRTEKLNRVTLKMVPDVGHQLGPVRNGQVGPISHKTLDVIGSWLSDRFPAAPVR